jgi:tetratricopeptide (TPR) repeat protein
MRALSVGDQDAAIQRLFPAFRLTCPFDFMGKWRGPLRPLARTYEIGIAYALAEFRRMIALDRNFAQGHTATGLGLMYAGEPARALEPFAIAMRLDPHYPDIVLHFLPQANFSLGKYEIAAQQLLDRIARNPSTDASRMLLASCYGHLGRAEHARAVWAELSQS